MKLEQLQQKLLAAARTCKPSDRVPYAFEKRILARLTSQPIRDHWALWSRALWRAAAPCVAVMLMFGVWAFVGGDNNPADPTGDFSQHFEQTMLAGVNDFEEVW